jgi:hypothetical protein
MQAGMPSTSNLARQYGYATNDNPAPPTSPTTTATASSGNGTATLSWKVTPHGHAVSGAYVGRDGTDTRGAGAWQSGLVAGTSAVVDGVRR